MTRKQQKRKKYSNVKKAEAKEIIKNIMIPLIAGLVIYQFFSMSMFGIGYKDGIAKLIRYYLPDMLWGYSLIFAMYVALGTRVEILKVAFIISAIFSLIMESIQILPTIPGTFDILDVVVELAAEVAAVFIIKNIIGRKFKYEEN